MNAIKHRPLNRDLLLWCFDRRYDLLLTEYKAYTSRNKQAIVKVRAYKTEDDCNGKDYILYIIKKNASGVYQEEPEVINNVLSLYIKQLNEVPISQSEALKLSHHTISFSSKAAEVIFKNCLKNSSKVAIHGFTNVGIIPSCYYNILGTNPFIAEFIDSKIRQFNIFASNNLPLPEHLYCHHINELSLNINHYISVLKDFLIIPEHSAGGASIKRINATMNQSDISDIINEISERDKCERYLLSKYMNDYYSVSCQCCITKNGSVVPFLCTDMVMDNYKYLGLKTPSALSISIQQTVMELTLKTGNILKLKGHTGYFGVDYIVSKEGNVLITEVNPRYTFTTLYYCKHYFRDNIFKLMDDKGDWGNVVSAEEKTCCILKKISKNKTRLNISTSTKHTDELGHFLENNEISLFDQFWDNDVNIDYGSYYGLHGIKGNINSEYEF